jgi:hypothetical protein
VAIRRARVRLDGSRKQTLRLRQVAGLELDQAKKFRCIRFVRARPQDPLINLGCLSEVAPLMMGNCFLQKNGRARCHAPTLVPGARRCSRNLLLAAVARGTFRAFLSASGAASAKIFSLGFSVLPVPGSPGRRGICDVACAPRGPCRQVMFEQHPAENCISDCSKCVFVVACGNISANVSVRRRGASPCRSFRSIRCPGD